MSLKVDKRIVTHNFKSVEIDDFDRWREEAKKNNVPVFYDRRNDIYCVGPTNDFEMYYNYLKFLNSNYSMWQRYGYFDMGMVPYLMWPSFMDNNPCLATMKNLPRRAGIDIVPVPAVTFLKGSYISNGADYWIFREDLVKLAKSIEEYNPDYRFGINTPEEATLSRFIKPFADACIALRNAEGGVQ